MKTFMLLLVIGASSPSLSESFSLTRLRAERRTPSRNAYHIARRTRCQLKHSSNEYIGKCTREDYGLDPVSRGSALRKVQSTVAAAVAVASRVGPCQLGWLLPALYAGGVPGAEALGGPSRPLNRCLTNVVNAKESARQLEADLAKGNLTQECRGMVKGILRGELRECVKDAPRYLPEGGGKRQVALESGRDAVEYMATVVEFDAWDKLDKEFTSNVALRNMTPENVFFVRQALTAAVSSMDKFLSAFPPPAVEEATDLYQRYYLPVAQQE
ncbi:unnamed protein product [Discosporangium mesarthrocarpum]